jgi:microcompartment protein CcmK/EutM
MSRGIFSERHFINTGLAPVADALAGTVNSDVVNTKLYDHVTFILIRGVGVTGTTVLTVEAATDNAGTGAEAIVFKSREGSGDGVALGALTTRAVAGYTTSAGSNKLDVIEVEAADTPDGKPFVRLHAVEGVDSPVAASILTILGDASYEEAVMPDATI